MFPPFPFSGDAVDRAASDLLQVLLLLRCRLLEHVVLLFPAVLVLLLAVFPCSVLLSGSILLLVLLVLFPRC